ncbi:PBP1b-binding outer membrane lipoprotein LpoB [Kibdelosporangium phytohabitans]|nr:PBP1b-binding outer membrane lipoprotein LpoB [Kibdelosporangium phytohabitans]
MRRSLAAFTAIAFLLTGCQRQQDAPAGDLDSVESTLNSVESELDEL